ncbi:Protein ZGRF1 [Ophiocordyceps camponoti-floridani]|uniref:Protein ZGRF1 n=1 Tax=Ophiocordyceps camponoti-floridani TaxID=2030778 RepID=A0A8H4VDW3_9HYPO|nr:Protein ZGRF1 [Ophiocordyceps camponoti-floridani]
MSHAVNKPDDVPQAPTSAPVLDYRCLFTHDLRRKQKRWQDGRLKYHTFNRRVMVYDDGGNLIGDAHAREGPLAEGDEMELENGAAAVVQDAWGEDACIDQDAWFDEDAWFHEDACFRGNEDVTMRDDSAGPRRSVEEAVGIETRRGDGDATPNDQRLRRQKTADETTQEENRVALPNDKVRRREKTLDQTSRGFNTAHDDTAIQSGLAGLHRKALEMVKATTRREDDHVAMPGDQLRRREEETADEMAHFSDTACDDVVMLDGPPTAGEKLAEKSINASIGRVAGKSVDVPGEVEFNEQDCRHQEAKATCETSRAESVVSTTVPQVPPLNDGQDFASHVPERPASVPSLDDNHASRDKEKMPLPGKRAELRIRSRQKRGLMMMADQRQKSPKPAPKQLEKPCLDYDSEIEVRKGSNKDDDAPPTPKRPRRDVRRVPDDGTERPRRQKQGPRIERLARKSTRSKEIFGFLSSSSPAEAEAEATIPPNRSALRIGQTLNPNRRPPLRSRTTDSANNHPDKQQPTPPTRQTSDPGSKPMVVNPATRGKKAARREDAMGQTPSLTLWQCCFCSAGWFSVALDYCCPDRHRWRCHDCVYAVRP